MPNNAKQASDKQIGRLPPHNDDAEVALLGSVLINRKAFEEVQTMLVKEDFYQLAHKQIWEGITGLRNERPGVALDYVSLSQYMSQKGTLAAAGGAAYIADLTNRVPTSTNAVYYAEIIRTASMKRQLFDLSIRIGDKAFDESSDIQESIDELDSTLSYLGTGSSTGQYEDAERLIGVVVDNVHDIMAGKKAVGVSSGFKILDKYIGGFKPSDLVIIAARPSVGKTALALSIAVNMAFGRKPVPVGFFSLEMSGATLIERIIANKGQINLMSLRNGKIDPETNTRMMTTAENLYENASNLLIQDTPNMKLLEICSHGA